MRRGPMFGDCEAGWGPDVLMRCDVIQEPFQTGDLSRAANQPAMQADTHHRRPASLALGMECFEGIDQILAEVLPRHPSRRARKAHVIRLQRVGYDQLVTFAESCPMGEIVVVSVGY